VNLKLSEKMVSRGRTAGQETALYSAYVMLLVGVNYCPIKTPLNRNIKVNVSAGKGRAGKAVGISLCDKR